MGRKRNANPGRIKCLKCGRPFNSIDRKYIRLCWNCKISNKKLKGGLETRNVKLREE